MTANVIYNFTVSNSLFKNNYGFQGAALHVNKANITLVNSTFVDNTQVSACMSIFTNFVENVYYCTTYRCR